MKHVLISIRLTLFLTVLLGLAYPGLVTLVAQAAFARQANGSLIIEEGRLRGSELIAQNFERPEYFWPRPSAVSFALPSGASNLGATSQALRDLTAQRSAKLRAAHPGEGEPPAHLLFASGSGLDPHQSPAAIRYQLVRVAAARGMDPVRLRALVDAHVERRQFGVLGEEVVNVLALNQSLDKLNLAKPTAR